MSFSGNDRNIFHRVTIRLNIFTNAEGMSENIRVWSSRDEIYFVHYPKMTIILFISCYFNDFKAFSMLIWIDVPRLEPQFSTGKITRYVTSSFDVNINSRTRTRVFPWDFISNRLTGLTVRISSEIPDYGRIDNFTLGTVKLSCDNSPLSPDKPLKSR